MKRATTMAVVVSLVLAGAAHGGVITFGLVKEFSWAVEPQGDKPWLTAVFEDVTAGVKLTLTATNLTGNEFVSKWYFNLAPDLDPSALLFEGSPSGTFVDPTPYLKKNEYKADGDGYFDILFAFAEAGGSDERFGVGDSIEYLITGIADLAASSFYHLSADKKGVPAAGGLYTAAHVQAIVGEDPNVTSGWVTTPEPVTLVLMGLGTAGLLVRHRRRG